MKKESNKSLIDRLFYNDKILLPLCIVLAVVLWAVVKINYSADVVRTISDMKVNLSESVEDSDYVAFIDKEGLTVEVEITGKAYNINTSALSKDDIIIEASTGYVDSAGYKTVSLTAKIAETAASDDFEITKITPSTITVYYDRKVTDTFNVVARIDKELDNIVKDGFYAGKAVPSLNTVEVTGPATVLSDMECVYFEAAIAEDKLPLEATIELPATVSFPVESRFSSFLVCASIDDASNPATVTLPVYVTKTVPATVKFINLPEGIEAPEYEISPSEVEIVYNPKDEKKYSEFSVGTVDFKKLYNIENTITLEIDHEKIPVKLTDKELTEFEFVADLSDYSETIVSYSVSNVIYLNKQDNMVYTLESVDGLDSIIVLGSEESVSKITSDDINIEINVSALNMSRSNSALLEANVTIGNAEIKDCWVYGEYQAYVTVMTEEEAAEIAEAAEETTTATS